MKPPDVQEFIKLAKEAILQRINGSEKGSSGMRHEYLLEKYSATDMRIWALEMATKMPGVICAQDAIGIAEQYRKYAEEGIVASGLTPSQAQQVVDELVNPSDKSS